MQHHSIYTMYKKETLQTMSELGMNTRPPWCKIEDCTNHYSCLAIEARVWLT